MKLNILRFIIVFVFLFALVNNASTVKIEHDDFYKVQFNNDWDLELMSWECPDLESACVKECLHWYGYRNDKVNGKIKMLTNHITLGNVCNSAIIGVGNNLTLEMITTFLRSNCDGS